MMPNTPNPKLKSCKSCGKEVAANAKACPNCGQAYPAHTINPEMVAGTIVTAIFIFGLVYFWDDIVDYYKAVFDLYDFVKQKQDELK